ncbi:MAG TPA: PQQ-dependent sugar dehydrogenase [Tepidisphaeraceae bacterium]|jgi:glucose/arabinose dehydrogenase
MAAGIGLMTATLAVAQDRGEVGPNVPAVWVRAGFKVTLAAEDIGRPVRFMQFGDDGTLYVSQPGPGKIVSLKDKDGDGAYETKADFLTGYKQVHSMAFDDGWLYATSSDDGSCRRMRDTDGDGKADQVETFLKPGSVPAGGGHPFRGIVISDSHVYVSVSDPSNMSEDLPSANKSVYRFNKEGGEKMQYATGLRNTEKLRLRPGTQEVWGLDHGSDNFGATWEGKGRNRPQPITDLLPGEELNRIEEGKFYGHPFVSNNRIIRPEFSKRDDILELATKTTPPAWILPAHWAGNGFTFLAKDYFPGMKGDIFAAYHGSWNSSARVGYRVERILFDPATGQPCGNMPIVIGLGDDGRQVLMRPVDCAEAPDGTVLFSCDTTQKVYRISKTG